MIFALRPSLSRSVRGSSRRRGRGFSTVETILAIVIATIVSIIGFSGFRLYNKELSLKSATRRINHAFATARSFAIARNGFYMVTLDLDNHQFWVDQTIDPAAPPVIITRYAKVISPELIDKNVVVEGVRYGPTTAPLVTAGLQNFLFRPDGSSDREARITMYEIGRDPTVGSNFYTVRLYAPTGLTRVFPHVRL